MIVTANGIIKRAMRLIRVLAAGESPKASEGQDGLLALNQMVDSWLLERLMIPQVLPTRKVLTSGTQTYTIGTGGSINIDRPNWIQDAGIIPAGVTPEVEIPMAILSDDEWAAITLKTTTSEFPSALWFNYAYSAGLGLITVWGIPESAPTLVLYCPKAALTTFAALATSYYVPPGYDLALVYNLAVALATEYGKPVPAEVQRIAIDSKGNVKRANVRDFKLGVDAAILQRNTTGGVYNFRTDGGA